MSELDFYRGKEWRECEEALKKRSVLLALEDEHCARVLQVMNERGPTAAVIAIATRLFTVDNGWKASTGRAICIYEEMREHMSKDQSARFHNFRCEVAWAGVESTPVRKGWAIEVPKGFNLSQRDSLAAMLLGNAFLDVKDRLRMLKTSENVAVRHIMEFIKDFMAE